MLLPLLTILSNATKTNIPFENFWNVNITDCIIAGSAALALGFGIYTAQKWQSKQTEIADKQYQLNAFLEIFKIMDDPEQKQARRTLEEFKNEPYRRDFYQQQFDKIRTTFDMMGMMYYQGSVPREIILENYWYIIIQCWEYMYQYIFDIRHNANLPLFARPFEILKDAALKFHKNHYPDQKLPVLKDPPP